MAQAYNASNLPFIHKHIALMPDCHQGYGVPIGSVICTEGVVIPNAVGVDIGCGVMAIQTRLEVITHEQLIDIMGRIRNKIPMGKGKHARTPCAEDWLPLKSSDTPLYTQNYNNARKQCGTLGGGNHFIEIQKGSDGFIWFMIHSGSRNLGHTIATHYNKVAKELNDMWHTNANPHWDLACLPAQSEEGTRYLAEMNKAVEFAERNRLMMASHIMNTFDDVFGHQVKFSEPLDIAHNYAAIENHYGKNVYVHRKGATRARPGEKGIIPGSQGTSSFIVTGLGSHWSFDSCSHGAGRTMSRAQAKKTLDLKEEQGKMKGVIHGMRNQSNLDEAPGSYKSIHDVMGNQKDLVIPEIELTPLASMKG
jgi:tRNA-splicing ligase RtcB